MEQRSGVIPIRVRIPYQQVLRPGSENNMLLELRAQGRLVHAKCLEEPGLEDNIDATFPKILA